MNIYGQLENATLEVLASDPATNVQGRFWLNSVSVRPMLDDGSLKRAIFCNDQRFIFGNHATPANNIRLNRGATGVLQFVLGNDVTAEGTLSTALAQISARQENYTTAGKPAAGNAGRLYFATDALTLFVDNGTSWQAVGSGGGGGSLQWIEADNAPTPSTDSANNGVFLFDAGLSQAIYCAIKVPSTYVAGKQINMIMPVYSSDTTGNALPQTVSTLIRAGTDAYTSTTNQRTSTNAAISLSGGTQNIPQTVTFDLTSSTGTINSVAVAANSLILVKLTRGVDTSTVQLAAMLRAAEVTFF